MPTMPGWMRAALWVTAFMNLAGAVALMIGFSRNRDWAGLSPNGPPIYGWIVAEFIFIFGLAYAYCAITARAPRLFIAVAAAGKLAFCATLMAFWLAGDLPFQSALLGSGDLIFGCLFLVWMMQTRDAP